MKQPTYRMQRVRIANCRVASNAYGGGGVAETTWIGHFMHDRFKHDDGKPHVVIPPMAEVVDNGDDRGDSGRKGGEADKRVEDGLVD